MKKNAFVSGLTFLLIILLSSGVIAEHGKTDQDKNGSIPEFLLNWGY